MQSISILLSRYQTRDQTNIKINFLRAHRVPYTNPSTQSGSLKAISMQKQKIPQSDEVIRRALFQCKNEHHWARAPSNLDGFPLWITVYRRGVHTPCINEGRAATQEKSYIAPNQGAPHQAGIAPHQPWDSLPPRSPPPTKEMS